MRTPGEIPMKVLMNKGFLATRSHASKPCVSIRELAGTRLTSMPVIPGGTGRRNRCQNFFSFRYFHGQLAARPLGWPLQMTNGKVRKDRIRSLGTKGKGPSYRLARRTAGSNGSVAIFIEGDLRYDLPLSSRVP